MVLGLPAGMPMSSFTVFQLPIRVLHLKVGHHQASFAFLRGGAEGAAVGPIDPAVEKQNGPTIRCGAAEIEFQRVRFGDA